MSFFKQIIMNNSGTNRYLNIIFVCWLGASKAFNEKSHLTAFCYVIAGNLILQSAHACLV